MDNLTLDDNHIYRYDGVIVPGVSEVLTAGGIVDVSAIPPERLYAAQKFGTAVHRACELSDLGTLDYYILDENLKPYLAGWELFRAEYGVNFKSIEISLYSKLYRYAGTIDRIGHWRIDNTLLIIDIKSGAAVMSVAPQLAAYELLAKEALGIKDKIKRIAVYLDNKGAYSVKEFKDKNDVNIFLACLSIYNWRKKNGKL